MSSPYLTPSNFRKIMTVSKDYKTKEELDDLITLLKKEQSKRELSNRTETKVYADTEAKIKSLDEYWQLWTPESRFGDTALTYAKEVALARLGVYIPDFKSYATEWGKQHEPLAREVFQERTGLLFPQENERMLCEHIPYISGESDGRIYGTDDRILVGEIKCPYNPVNHLDNIKEFKQYEDYKDQIAGYCEMNKAEGFYFISFHPEFPGKGNLVYKYYDRDQEVIDELLPVLELFEYKVVRPLVSELENLFDVSSS